MVYTIENARQLEEIRLRILRLQKVIRIHKSYPLQSIWRVMQIDKTKERLKSSMDELNRLSSRYLKRPLHTMDLWVSYIDEF